MKPTIQIDVIKPTRAQRIAAALAVLALFDFGGAPICKAVTPAPDGGYANGNTAEGTSALFSLTSGSNNTALGYQALFSDTGGSGNTATGWDALRFNTGNDNTATGTQALYKNTTGTVNTAVGRSALLLNTVGVGNTAVGGYALTSATGSYNTGVGDGALHKASGGSNSALGTGALGANTSGTGNVGVGIDALSHNRLGNDNTAIGSGGGGLISGSGNVYIGPDTTAYADDESDTTRISNIYSSVATTRAVYIDGDNKIGTLSSSRRYKDEIKPMDAASETLFALRPVSFRYKKEVDRSRALSFGLIAEEVAEVDPDLITRDKEGQPQTVRYDAVNAMLLNEFLKEHAKVQQLEASVDAVATQIKEQKAKIEKVSAQLQTRRAVSQVAMNNP
jgi:hypothetical protein